MEDEVYGGRPRSWPYIRGEVYYFFFFSGWPILAQKFFCGLGVWRVEEPHPRLGGQIEEWTRGAWGIGFNGRAVQSGYSGFMAVRGRK